MRDSLRNRPIKLPRSSPYRSLTLVVALVLLALLLLVLDQAGMLGAIRPQIQTLLTPVMRTLEERATRKDDTYFQERGFAGARDFLRRYQRLSGALWLSAAPGAPPSFWRNPQARHPLPADLARALSRPAP